MRILAFVFLLGACAVAPPPSASVALGLAPGEALPEWAERMAPSLPETTWHMLRLDHRHRVRNPLGPAVAAAVRASAARQLGCEVLARSAERDAATTAEDQNDPAAAALAAEFAAAMVQAPRELPADLLERAIARFEAKGVVALVHTVAFTNFQARLIQGLGAAGELPLVRMRADAKPPSVAVPERTAPPNAATASSAVPPSWNAITAETRNGARLAQQQRTPRLSAPADATLEPLTERERKQAERVVWSRYSYGHQPELTREWFACLYAFYREAKVDPVLQNMVFWVVTRTHDCFY